MSDGPDGAFQISRVIAGQRRTVGIRPCELADAVDEYDERRHVAGTGS